MQPTFIYNDLVFRAIRFVIKTSKTYIELNSVTRYKCGDCIVLFHVNVRVHTHRITTCFIYNFCFPL